MRNDIQNIKRIASEAGFGFDPTFWRCCPKPMWLAEPAELARFAALVRAQALEEAARKADHYAALLDGIAAGNFRNCAAAIRALGDTK